MKVIIIISFLAVYFAGCSVWKGIGSDLGDGLIESFEERDSLFSSIGGNITKGARDSIINIETEMRIQSLVENTLRTTNREALVLIDSLLGIALQSKLKEIGETARLEAALLRNDLLGDQTQLRVALLRNELIGDTTIFKLAQMRNELLGAGTGLLLDSLIGGALSTVILKYDELMPRLSSDLRAEGSFLQKNASTLLWTAGGIIALLIIIGGIVYFKSRRYKEISELLTYQIHKIPDQQSYDELTARIKNHAQQNSVEPDLRKLLTNQGIIYDTNWKK
jgi:hypothetical protein